MYDLILNEHLDMSVVWVVVNLRTDTMKTCAKKRLDKVMCPKSINHLRRNSQQNEEDIHDLLITQESLL